MSCSAVEHRVSTLLTAEDDPTWRDFDAVFAAVGARLNRDSPHVDDLLALFLNNGVDETSPATRQPQRTHLEHVAEQQAHHLLLLRCQRVLHADREYGVRDDALTQRHEWPSALAPRSEPALENGAKECLRALSALGRDDPSQTKTQIRTMHSLQSPCC